MYDVIAVIFIGLGEAKRWGGDVIWGQATEGETFWGVDLSKHHECSTGLSLTPKHISFVRGSI